MSKLKFDITMSLDGFIAGPNPGPEAPLGEGGERLHEWVYGLRSFQERHGRGGGETNRDDEIAEEALANTGAAIMGRGMFGGGPGPWEETWEGWWGDEPPFGVPVFILTHHAREPLAMKGGTTFTFVTDGIESALEQARGAADGKDVAIAGGGRVVQQYLDAGLVDEFQVHVAPVLLGDGVRLFDQPGPDQVELQIDRVVESEAVTHLRYSIRATATG
ncbi:MAG: dihydrofolate reductase family protein [Actinobacteria bacterium]|jgi:dihydrofolate reductase|nr:dihydrofolate reductase family protein [Actinomycetota bacterium]